MRLCTYNIWNSENKFETRLDLLVIELSDKKIDLLALQEVKDEITFKRIKKKLNYNTGIYYNGLGFLSNYDIAFSSSYTDNNNYLLRVTYKNTSFTNVHLDWGKIENRVYGLDAYFTMLETNVFDTEFILGDFNDTPQGKLHHELVMSAFDDVHKTYSHSKNDYPLPTLDTLHNPRWRNNKTKDEPSRFDWIMLNTTTEYSIENTTLIGTKEFNQITPSDHYGVMSDIKIVL
jgi:endonuclease/exonuclease/phosphatase family metal-dependent hydrolase